MQSSSHPVINRLADRFRQSWEVVKVSWTVLLQDKELLAFPILSSIAGILLFIGLAIPGMAVVANWTVANPDGSTVIHGEGGDFVLGGMILWYFSTAFVATFMNAALVACVRKRLAGGDPTLGYGLTEAARRIVPILGWSLLTTSVGILLRLMASGAKERGGLLGFIGQVVVGLIGFAWTIATMFVVPVMIIEGSGVFASFKRSAELLRRTWGEQLILNASVGFVFTYLYGAVAGLVTFVVFLRLFVIPFAIWPVVVAAGLFVAIAFVLQFTLTGIFNTVLYTFATGEKVPGRFGEIAPLTLTAPSK